jgi:hypothetical protein
VGVTARLDPAEDDPAGYDPAEDDAACAGCGRTGEPSELAGP